MASKYRHVGRTPIVLASGRPVAPGDTVGNVDPKDPDDRAAIDDGVLVELPTPPRRGDKEATS